jgi:hypothetical protein
MVPQGVAVYGVLPSDCLMQATQAGAQCLDGVRTARSFLEFSGAGLHPAVDEDDDIDAPREKLGSNPDRDTRALAAVRAYPWSACSST